MKSFLFVTCLVVTPVFATPALAASGVMLRDDDLRASASAGAARVGRVAKGAAVEVLGRQGGWTQVAEGNRRGWVRILSLRAEAGTGAGAGLAGLVEAGTRRSDSSRVVAVAGLRGLNEEELKAARFDGNELTKLDRYRVERATAEQYAREGGLRHRDLDHLAAPQKAQDTGPGSASYDGGLL